MIEKEERCLILFKRYHYTYTCEPCLAPFNQPTAIPALPRPATTCSDQGDGPWHPGFSTPTHQTPNATFPVRLFIVLLLRHCGGHPRAASTTHHTLQANRTESPPCNQFRPVFHTPPYASQALCCLFPRRRSLFTQEHTTRVFVCSCVYACAHLEPNTQPPPTFYSYFLSISPYFLLYPCLHAQVSLPQEHDHFCHMRDRKILNGVECLGRVPNCCCLPARPRPPASGTFCLLCL
jgi:hypothetical protein